MNRYCRILMAGLVVSGVIRDTWYVVGSEGSSYHVTRTTSPLFGAEALNLPILSLPGRVAVHERAAEFRSAGRAVRMLKAVGHWIDLMDNHLPYWSSPIPAPFTLSLFAPDPMKDLQKLAEKGRWAEADEKIRFLMSQHLSAQQWLSLTLWNEDVMAGLQAPADARLTRYREILSKFPKRISPMSKEAPQWLTAQAATWLYITEVQRRTDKFAEALESAKEARTALNLVRDKKDIKTKWNQTNGALHFATSEILSVLSDQYADPKRLAQAIAEAKEGVDYLSTIDHPEYEIEKLTFFFTLLSDQMDYQTAQEKVASLQECSIWIDKTERRLLEFKQLLESKIRRQDADALSRVRNQEEKFLRAHIYVILKVQDWETALLMLRQYQEQFPDSPFVAVSMATVELKLGHIGEAMTWTRRIENPSNLQWLERGLIFLSAAQEKTVQDPEVARQLYSEAVDAWRHVDRPEAREEFKRHKTLPIYLASMAEAYLGLHQVDEAVRWLEQLLKEEAPSDIMAMRLAAQAETSGVAMPFLETLNRGISTERGAALSRMIRAVPQQDRILCRHLFSINDADKEFERLIQSMDDRPASDVALHAEVLSAQNPEGMTGLTVYRLLQAVDQRFEGETSSFASHIRFLNAVWAMGNNLMRNQPDIARLIMATASLDIAEAYEIQGNWDKAIDHAETAIQELEPLKSNSDIKDTFYLAQRLAVTAYLSRWDESGHSAADLLSAHPILTEMRDQPASSSDSDFSLLADVVAELAWACCRIGFYSPTAPGDWSAEAHRLTDELVARFPDSTHGALMVGLLALVEGRSAEAVAPLQFVLEKKRDPLAEWALGRAYIRLSQADKVPDVFQKIDEKEALASARYDLGRSYMLQAREREAFEVWRAAIESPVEIGLLVAMKELGDFCRQFVTAALHLNKPVEAAKGMALRLRMLGHEPELGARLAKEVTSAEACRQIVDTLAGFIQHERLVRAVLADWKAALLADPGEIEDGSLREQELTILNEFSAMLARHQAEAWSPRLLELFRVSNVDLDDVRGALESEEWRSLQPAAQAAALSQVVSGALLNAGARNRPEIIQCLITETRRLLLSSLDLSSRNALESSWRAWEGQLEAVTLGPLLEQFRHWHEADWLSSSYQNLSMELMTLEMHAFGRLIHPKNGQAMRLRLRAFYAGDPMQELEKDRSPNALQNTLRARSDLDRRSDILLRYVDEHEILAEYQRMDKSLRSLEKVLPAQLLHPEKGKSFRDRIRAFDSAERFEAIGQGRHPEAIRRTRLEGEKLLARASALRVRLDELEFQEAKGHLEKEYQKLGVYLDNVEERIKTAIVRTERWNALRKNLTDFPQTRVASLDAGRRADVLAALSVNRKQLVDRSAALLRNMNDRELQAEALAIQSDVRAIQADLADLQKELEILESEIQMKDVEGFEWSTFKGKAEAILVKTDAVAIGKRPEAVMQTSVNGNALRARVQAVPQKIAQAELDYAIQDILADCAHLEAHIRAGQARSEVFALAFDPNDFASWHAALSKILGKVHANSVLAEATKSQLADVTSHLEELERHVMESSNKSSDRDGNIAYLRNVYRPILERIFGTEEAASADLDPAIALLPAPLSQETVMQRFEPFQRSEDALNELLSLLWRSWYQSGNRSTSEPDELQKDWLQFQGSLIRHLPLAHLLSNLDSDTFIAVLMHSDPVYWKTNNYLEAGYDASRAIAGYFAQCWEPLNGAGRDLRVVLSAILEQLKRSTQGPQLVNGETDLGKYKFTLKLKIPGDRQAFLRVQIVGRPQWPLGLRQTADGVLLTEGEDRYAWILLWDPTMGQNDVERQRDLRRRIRFGIVQTFLRMRGYSAREAYIWAKRDQAERLPDALYTKAPMHEPDLDSLESYLKATTAGQMRRAGQIAVRMAFHADGAVFSSLLDRFLNSVSGSEKGIERTRALERARSEGVREAKQDFVFVHRMNPILLGNHEERGLFLENLFTRLAEWTVLPVIDQFMARVLSASREEAEVVLKKMFDEYRATASAVVNKLPETHMQNTSA